MNSNQYKVYLGAPSRSKLSTLKLVKDLTGLGLKESKRLVDDTAIEPQLVAVFDDIESAKRVYWALNEGDCKAFIADETYGKTDLEILLLDLEIEVKNGGDR